MNWREWTRELQGEGVRGQLGRKWYERPSSGADIGQHVLLEGYEF